MNPVRVLVPAALALAIVTAFPVTAAAAVTDQKADVTGIQATGHYDRFIVRYRSGSNERMRPDAVVQNVAAALARAIPVTGRNAPVTARVLRQMAVGGTVVKFSRALGSSEATSVMKAIVADPAVIHVEPDLLMHASRVSRPAAVAAAPDDEYFAVAQWDLTHPIGGMNLPAVWDSFPGIDGTGITVAVIDTGITEHDDLDTSLASAGYDFITDSFVSGRASDGRVAGGWDLGDWTNADPWLASCTDFDHPPESSTWHGSNVAGVIAERTNNAIGTAGVAPGAKVLPIRALGHCGGYTSDIADAIVWAAGGQVDGVPDNTHRADVINMSLGGGGACVDDSVTRDAINLAIGLGTTVVVAAGNSTDDAANYTPASCPGVVTVGATGITGRRAFYSNYGSTVTLAAPGGGIYTNDAPNGAIANPDGFIWAAYNSGLTTPVSIADGGVTYAGMAGTSQATPHVAATVALMLDAASRMSLPRPAPGDIKAMLAASTRPFPRTPDKFVGSGILDAQRAVAMVVGVQLPEQVTVLMPGALSTPVLRAAGGSAVFSIDVPAGARNLVIRSVGGTGDASLFVKAESAPVADGSDATVRSVHPGNTESVIVNAPVVGTWFVRLSAVKDFENVTVLATYVR